MFEDGPGSLRLSRVQTEQQDPDVLGGLRDLGIIAMVAGKLLWSDGPGVSRVVTVAVLVGLWRGTGFPYGVRWSRAVQTGMLGIYALLAIVAAPLSWGISGAALVLFAAITVVHCRRSLQNPRVFDQHDLDAKI